MTDVTLEASGSPIPAPSRPLVSYKSFGPSSNKGYFSLLCLQVAQFASDLGIDARVDPLERGEFATKQVRAFHPHAVARMVADAYRASTEGIDAIVIGNIQDPGLTELRQAACPPVLGLLETVVLATRPFTSGLALVATSPLTVPLLRERVRAYGAEWFVGAIGSMGSTLVDWGTTFDDPRRRSELVVRFVSAAAGLVQGGVDAVVPASGLMAAALGAEWGLRPAWDGQIEGAVVLNPIAIALAHAAVAARLHRTGLAVSRSGAYYRPAESDLRSYADGILRGEQSRPELG